MASVGDMHTYPGKKCRLALSIAARLVVLRMAVLASKMPF